jgi:hypothetical protein
MIIRHRNSSIMSAASDVVPETYESIVREMIEQLEYRFRNCDVAEAIFRDAIFRIKSMNALMTVTSIDDFPLHDVGSVSGVVNQMELEAFRRLFRTKLLPRIMKSVPGNHPTPTDVANVLERITKDTCGWASPLREVFNPGMISI